jgi:hypothetical protein
MAGYPDIYNVPSRNRSGSNQPGSLSDPHSRYTFDTLPTQNDKMSMMAAEIRQYPSPEPDINYEECNFPDYEDTVTFDAIQE